MRARGIINCGLIKKWLTFRISRLDTPSNYIFFVYFNLTRLLNSVNFVLASDATLFIFQLIYSEFSSQGKHAMWPRARNGRIENKNIDGHILLTREWTVGHWSCVQFDFMFGWIRETADVHKYHIAVIDEIQFYLSNRDDRIQKHLIAKPYLFSKLSGGARSIPMGWIDRCLTSAPLSMWVKIISSQRTNVYRNVSCTSNILRCRLRIYDAFTGCRCRRHW